MRNVEMLSMYIRNSNGPSTERWGTLEITGVESEDTPFTTTFLLMLSKVAAQPVHNQRMQIELLHLFHKSSVGNSIKSFLEVKKYTAYFITLVKLS